MSGEKVTATASEELRQVVEETKNVVLDKMTTIEEKQQTLDNMESDLLERLDKMERRAVFPEADLAAFRHDGTPKSFHKNVIARQVRPGTPGADQVRSVQKLSDEVLLMNVILEGCKANKVGNTPEGIYATDIWKEYGRELKKLGVEKAANDNWETSETTDWIPIDMSGDLHEFIQMELRVAGLFSQFTLPTATFYWPHVTGAPSAETASEANDPALYPNYDITKSMFGAAPPDAKATFVAKKARAFQFYSREWQEDTIRATMPWLMRQLPQAIARAYDSAIINGDVGGSTIGDATSTETSGWFDGLRAYVIGQAGRSGGTGAGGGQTTDQHEFQFMEGMTGSAWVIAEFPDELRKQRKRMDKYGVRLSNLVYIVGLDAYYQMMSIPNFQTLDKLGPQATLLTGQVGAFDSIPVVLSEFMNLSVQGHDDTTATDDGINETFPGGGHESKGLILVETSEWLRARLPGFGAEVVRFPHDDLYEVVIFERADFNTIGPATALNVNFGYDIPIF
jgi:hypothetical protein